MLNVRSNVFYPGQEARIITVAVNEHRYYAVKGAQTSTIFAIASTYKEAFDWAHKKGLVLQ